MYKIKYILENWKLIIHLLFRTCHLGVDNYWWSPYKSLFGLPFYKRFNLIKNYKLAKIRASCGFIPMREAKLLFGNSLVGGRKNGCHYKDDA